MLAKRKRTTKRGGSLPAPTQRVLGTGRRERSRHPIRKGESVKLLILEKTKKKIFV